jgi:TolB-like protein/Flp pilus assembly protein TadD
MRAYITRGERGMAIQAYERCRSVLADLLDAQPSEETQRLAAEIRASAQQVRAPVAAIRIEPARDSRLPQRLAIPELRGDARSEPRGEVRGEVRPEPRPDSRPEARPASPRAGARVGVLPLQLVGAGEAEAHLATGLADEITAAMARFRWMSLVSSSSLARFAAQSRDEAAIRRAFGIDFLLDGTIQRAQDRLRVSLRLLDLRVGNQIVWSRRFDRDSSDTLVLQDEIAAEVAAQIDPEILMIEAQRAAQRPQAEAGAYDLMLRAVPLIARLEKPQFLQAGEMLRQSILLEPDYGAAHGWAAYWHLFLVSQGWTHEPAAKMAEAGRLADRGVLLDPQDARALTIAGHVRTRAGGRLREAQALHERALHLNPNLAMAWSLSGLAHAYAGDLAEAQRRLDHYKKLSPMDPHAFYLDTALPIVALMRRDYEAAVDFGREVSEMNPSFAGSYKPYLAALGHLGHEQEAMIARKRLLAIQPDFTVRMFSARSPFSRSADLEHYVAGLRKVGIGD